MSFIFESGRKASLLLDGMLDNWVNEVSPTETLFANRRESALTPYRLPSKDLTAFRVSFGVGRDPLEQVLEVNRIKARAALIVL